MINQCSQPFYCQRVPRAANLDCQQVFLQVFLTGTGCWCIQGVQIPQCFRVATHIRRIPRT